MTFQSVMLVVTVYFLINILQVVVQRIWPMLGPAPDPNVQRLDRLEREINQLRTQLGIEIKQELPLDRVREMIVVGRKIEAIKLYREQMSVDLVTAKKAVDSMEAQMKASDLVGS